MQHEINENNHVAITGTVLTEPSNTGEFQVSVNRLSGMADTVPVMLSEELKDTTITKGSTISIHGQFQSYNKIVNDRSKLILTVLAQEISNEPASGNPNLIELTGYICKAPIYRTTPFNREIADLLIAVNRTSNKSDYIPVIAWGRNARFAKNLLIGDKVSISGRIQSREYQKRLEDGSTETRTAYEISINNLTRDEADEMPSINSNQI